LVNPNRSTHNPKVADVANVQGIISAVMKKSEREYRIVEKYELKAARIQKLISELRGALAYDSKLKKTMGPSSISTAKKHLNEAEKSMMLGIASLVRRLVPAKAEKLQAPPQVQDELF